ADGLDAMKLRAFAVPPAEPDAAALQPELRLDGWAWFAPAADGEHLALATDAGEFVLCEIRGRADGAAPLVPLFRERLAPAAGARAGAGRARVVHAAGKAFWVLAHGGLHRLQSAFLRRPGPRLLPPGPALLTVGSPLHAPQVQQVHAGGQERTVFY